MKRLLFCYFNVLVVLLTACTPAPEPTETTTPLKVAKLDNTVKIVAGQTVYVPIYSHIYTWDQNRKMDLTATLSVRNTDLTRAMIVTSVNYYGTDGKLIRKYLEQPVQLDPLASTSFLVNQEDRSGGAGAAFIVEWVSQNNISSPVIESVMINTGGNQGISFVSSGRVIKSRSTGG
jgi:hypothetical protein